MDTQPNPPIVPSARALDAQKKAALIQSIAQLEMLVMAFSEAPERVKLAAVEFRDALKEWASQ